MPAHCIYSNIAYLPVQELALIRLKILAKILLSWLILLMIYSCCLYFLPHGQISFSSIINRAIQSLLFIVSIFLVISEKSRRNQFVFANFVAFFAISIFQIFHDFLGIAFLQDVKYARFFSFEYLSLAYTFFLSIAVVYAALDSVFQDFKIYQKYCVTLLVAGSFFVVMFYPFFQDPLYLYSTEDIRQWKILNEQATAVGTVPSAAQLASTISLESRDRGLVSVLTPESNLKRIEELLPYLEGENWVVLLYRPMFSKIIYMNVLLIGSVLLFFGYQYKKDPPQGAYLDKIMFLLLLFSSMEILHNYGYIQSVELGSWTELFIIGQYVSFAIELLIVLFFGLRLRFITSVQGEYYESELASNPNQVTRWRDWVDNIVLAHFFNFKIFNGRLFQKTSGR